MVLYRYIVLTLFSYKVLLCREKNGEQSIDINRRKSDYMSMQTVQQVTFALVQALQDYRTYYPKPFECYRSMGGSLWWISPTNTPSVYEHGKYFVNQENEHLQIGLHIEKGFEEIASQPKKLTLAENWTWHSFTESLERGQVCDIIEQMQYMYGHTIHCRFDIKSLTGELRQQFYWHEGIIKDAHSQLCKTLEQLPSLFAQKDEVRGCWIDCFIYVEQPFAEELVVEDLIDHVLMPLEQWVR